MTRFVRGFWLAVGLGIGSAVAFVTGQGFGGAGFGSSGGGLATTAIDTCAELAAIMGDEVGTCGGVVLSVDAVFATSMAIPQAAAPTVNAAGEIALDTNRWGVTGAFIGYDGAAIVKFIGILDSDTCTDGQTVKFTDASDTWTCENDNDTGGTTEFDDFANPSGNGLVNLGNTTHVWDSTLDAAAGVILELSDTDAALANATNVLRITYNDDAGAEMVWFTLISDKDGTPATNFSIFGNAAVGSAVVQIGATGVTLADDDDGALTITGNSTGSDEDLTFNFDDTSNIVDVTTSTGVTNVRFAMDLSVPDEAYDATNWNGSVEAPTKNAIRDYIETNFLTIPADPDADRILFWDDSAGSLQYLSFAGTALTFSGTTIVLTTTHEVTFPVAVCQNATATLGGNTATTLGPTAVCESVTAAQAADVGYGAATFPTGGADTEWHQHFGRLPTGWTGNFDAVVHWRAISTTANDVVWRVATGCLADAQAPTDISFNTTSVTADTNKGTTLQLNDTATTTLTMTGCAAGEQLFIKVLRDTDTAGDTLDADVQLVAITFIYRKTQ